MAYKVEILPAALRDAEEALIWWREQAPTRADLWYRGLIEAVASLEEFPARCSIAQQESAELGIEIRQFLYGRSTQVYRIYFRIVDTELVRVLRIRHASREKLDATELQD